MRRIVVHPRRGPLLTGVVAGLLVVASISFLTAREGRVPDAQNVTVQTDTADPPAELADAIRSLVNNQHATVTRGDTVLEFWWVKSIPLTGTGQPAWSSVSDGTLVGALRVAGPFTDIRGMTLKPGVYTLRFARQPQDGDHMGVSPFREFLLPCPAAADTTPDSLGFKPTVALAKKSSGESHPSAISIDPPSSSSPPGQVVTNDQRHTAVTFAVPTGANGAASGTLSFGVIVVGTIEHQM